MTPFRGELKTFCVDFRIDYIKSPPPPYRRFRPSHVELQILTLLRVLRCLTEGYHLISWILSRLDPVFCKLLFRNFLIWMWTCKRHWPEIFKTCLLGREDPETRRCARSPFHGIGRKGTLLLAIGTPFCCLVMPLFLRHSSKCAVCVRTFFILLVALISKV